MENKRIKSALELAMERMAGMSQLTGEELMAQKEKEYQPRGAAIAHKYLEGALRERDLPTELRRYKGEEGEIVSKAVLSTLCQSIKIEDMSQSRKAIDGIQAVATTANLDEIRREAEAIFSEFYQQMEQRYATYEDRGREKLRELWLSGSAVSPNLEESQDWRQELSRLQSEYTSRIDKLRENLSRLIGI